jgi:hypothetical protein
LLAVRRGGVVFAGQVLTEVSVEIPPDGVDVIGVVLRVVVLDQEGRPLDPVIVPLAGGLTASPRETNLVKSRLLDSCEVLGDKAEAAAV